MVHHLGQNLGRGGGGVVLAAALAASLGGPARAQSTVASFNATPDHAGLFAVPGLTQAKAASTTQDTAFDGAVSGVVNATPLYWHPAGAASGWIIVATENNAVSALDEVTGLPVWTTQLGPAATRSGDACGNISPAGVTGTPVIDTTTGTLYLDALIQTSGGEQHMVFAVSLATGAIIPGWPVAAGAGVRALGKPFIDSVEEQRGALALLGGRVFVPFGGYSGDCGAYHGVVAGIDKATPGVGAAWATEAEKGGIWAPSGVVSDGSSLFFATGNTASAAKWGGGEAIIREGTQLARVNDTNDYFTPGVWRQLDNDDDDLGGVAPTLIDLPNATPSQLVMALGKDGNAYLLDRTRLGGVSHALQTMNVANRPITAATARYSLNNGDVMVVVRASTPSCGSGLLAIRVSATAGSPRMKRGWCAASSGRGEPIVTSTDGVHNSIVWVAGAEGDEQLHAFAGDTGAPLYSSASLPSTVRHFSSLLVANKRLYVPADGKIFAFNLPAGP